MWSATRNRFDEKHSNYAGTWGIGAQIRSLTFIEDLMHTIRVAYWGGTNDPSMVKYFSSANGYAANDGYEGPYLTKNDGLLEFNLDSTYKVYDNLKVAFDLGYIVNFMDAGTWKHSGSWNAGTRGNMSKRDAWKAQLTFNYTF